MINGITRNVDQVYVYITDDRWPSIRYTHKRMPAHTNETVYLCEVVSVNKDIAVYDEKLVELLKEAGITDINGDTVSTKFRYIPTSVTEDTLVISIMSGIKQLLTEKDMNKDKLDAERKRKNEMKKNFINTFCASSLQSILDKYGMRYNDMRGGIEINPRTINEVLLNLLNNTLIPELKAVGVNATLNDELINTDNNSIRKIVHNSKLKFNLDDANN